MNSIYLRSRRKVHVNEGGDSSPLNVLASLQKNVESLGFVLSERLINRLQTLSAARLETFYKNLIKDLREMVGAHRQFKPMYPNFPAQVMEMSEAGLYLNAVFHYLTNRLPSYEEVPRPALIDRPDLRVIELGSREDFESIFRHLAGSRTSLSPQDKKDLAWFVTQYRDEVVRLMPPEVPLKENLAFLGAQLMRHTSVAPSLLDSRIKTATDVLRLAVALSDGDVSLAEPTKFVTLRRRDRKCLLSWLERCQNRTEDMLRWKEPWKRLGERLHPGDYSTTFPQTYVAFQVLRDDRPFETFNSRIECRLRSRDAFGVLKLLEGRPGDLCRRLDHLLRLASDQQSVLEAFGSRAGNVSTPVLLQVLTHFARRSQPGPLRTFFPKGEVAKVYAVSNRLPSLRPETCQQVVEICEQTLLARFAKLPALGKCYLDAALSNHLVPFSQRSAAKALRTLVRGSRVPLPDARCVRFFLWWKNGSSRTDIDLSAAVYDANYNYVDVVSYYNLKNFGGHHSGDIVDAPQGAAEFIDLDVELSLARGVRFVVMCLNSFTEQPYCDLPECFAGWMGRTHPGSGEIFEPRTVHDKVDIAANTRICIPVILDLIAREVVWADVALRKGMRWNNVHNNLSGVSLMLRALTTLVKTNLHTLFSLHIKARGEIVREKQEANHIFSVDEGITPFDLDRIAAEYL